MIQHDQAKPEVDSELRNSLLFLILPLTFMTKVFKLVTTTIYDGLISHKKKKKKNRAEGRPGWKQGVTGESHQIG